MLANESRLLDRLEKVKNAYVRLPGNKVDDLVLEIDTGVYKLKTTSNRVFLEAYMCDGHLHIVEFDRHTTE